MTTYTSLVNSISGLSITGLTRQFDHIPEYVDTSDLPASFVRLPGGGINPETLTTCSGDGKTRTIELVVLLEPFGQSTASANFSATVSMMDNVETALDADDGSTPIMPFLTYEINASGETIGEGDYWAIVATITGIE